MITAERLRELLRYNAETGVFCWRVEQGRGKIGSVAGTLNTLGYRKIKIDSRRYAAHRLAWLYAYGCWPVDEIDHINDLRDDNRLANLREATRRENMQKAKCRNSTKFRGVCRSRRKWMARITVNSRQRSLGRFGTPEEAHAAYCQAAARYFGEFAQFG